ncbi:MAG: hypothetical protein LBP21_09350 [Synergistaceae bacterium]|jgi:hypothetical protein|nr:hypothetical protein [Synergistaceae bacterium]
MIAAIKALYNAFPIAMLAGTALFRITWLEMRVNLGWIFFALWGILAVILGTWSRFFVKLLDVRGTTANLCVCGLGIFLLSGRTRLFSTPAALIREGLGLTRLPFLWINATIAGFLLLGWLALFFANRKQRAPRN